VQKVLGRQPHEPFLSVHRPEPADVGHEPEEQILDEEASGTPGEARIGDADAERRADDAEHAPGERGKDTREAAHGQRRPLILDSDEVALLLAKPVSSENSTIRPTIPSIVRVERILSSSALNWFVMPRAPLSFRGRRPRAMSSRR
jgi:hypothetical protein